MFDAVSYFRPESGLLPISQTNAKSSATCLQRARREFKNRDLEVVQTDVREAGVTTAKPQDFALAQRLFDARRSGLSDENTNAIAEAIRSGKLQLACKQRAESLAKNRNSSLLQCLGTIKAFSSFDEQITTTLIVLPQTSGSD